MKKIRRDVMSSDRYCDSLSDDDSLPDLATAVSKKWQAKATEQASHTPRNQENRAPDGIGRPRGKSAGTGTESMAINAFIQQTTSSETLPRTATTTATSTFPSRTRIQIDLDPISSSSPRLPVPTSRPAYNRSATTQISSSPRLGPPVRTPLHRANTFPSNPYGTSPPNALDAYVIDDDDDEDLKAAIAASLADMQETQILATDKPSTWTFRYPPSISGSPPSSQALPAAKPAKAVASTFQVPEDILRSTLPSSQSRTPIPQKPTTSIVDDAPRSTPPSSQNRIREDTKRMLEAIENLTLPILKRKAESESTTKKPGNKTSVRSTTSKSTATSALEEDDVIVEKDVPTKKKRATKTMTENGDAPTAQRSRFTEEEKVPSARSALLKLTTGRPRR